MTLALPRRSPVRKWTAFRRPGPAGERTGTTSVQWRGPRRRIGLSPLTLGSRFLSCSGSGRSPETARLFGCLSPGYLAGTRAAIGQCPGHSAERGCYVQDPLVLILVRRMFSKLATDVDDGEFRVSHDTGVSHVATRSLLSSSAVILTLREAQRKDLQLRYVPFDPALVCNRPVRIRTSPDSNRSMSGSRTR